MRGGCRRGGEVEEDLQDREREWEVVGRRSWNKGRE